MSSEAPQVHISLSLTDTTYHRKAAWKTQPSLCARTELMQPDVLSIEIRGESDGGTVLENGFRMEHVEWIDVADGSTVEVEEPFPGTCEPRVYLEPRNVIELKKGTVLETRQLLNDTNPLSDPVNRLETGHVYYVRLKPQKVWWIAKAKDEVFQEQQEIPISELPGVPLEVLESGDVVTIKVEK